MNLIQNILHTYTFAQWMIILIAILLCVQQGIFLFRDAQRRGRFPWIWGIWGLVSFPLPSIFYYFFIIRGDRKKRKQ